VDIAGRSAVCPAGQNSTHCSRLEEAATGKVTFRFEWKQAQCGGCPKRAEWVGPTQPHRTLALGEHHHFLQERRREMHTEAFQTDMHRRNRLSYARLVERDMVDVIEHPINNGKTDRGARQTMAAAIKFLDAKKPTFLFAHLDHVDHAGHQIGWFSEEYFAAVRGADKLIGERVAAIKQAGLENDTIILITADHGGAGKKHGGATMGAIEIPWIIAGPSIKPGHVITAPVNTYDTAPTLAKIFGLTPPTCWIARPVRSAFVQSVE